MYKRQVWTGEFTNQRKDGAIYRQRMTISPIVDDQGCVSSYFSIAEEVSKERELEDRLEALTSTDALTGLHNRAGFMNELTRLALLADEMCIRDRFRNTRGAKVRFRHCTSAPTASDEPVSEVPMSRILIVDDESSILKSLRRLLLLAPGSAAGRSDRFDVDCCEDPFEALKKARYTAYDLSLIHI